MTTLPGNLIHKTVAGSLLPANGVRLIAQKEAFEIIASPRGLAWLLMLTMTLSAFSLLFVANTELSLLDNAEVVYAMMSVITALGALLAVIAGVDATAGERERGSLMPLLLAPISRSQIVFGKLGGPLAAWIAMLVLGFPYLWAVGSTGQNLLSGILALAVFGTPVVLGFGFLALALGAWLRSARSALSISLAGLFLSASPLLLGPSLRQSLVGRAFDAINPFSGALNAFDAIVIDSQPFGAQGFHGISLIGWTLLTLLFAWASTRRMSH